MEDTNSEFLKAFREGVEIEKKQKEAYNEAVNGFVKFILENDVKQQDEDDE